ncbi:choice-of-anchor Q domain-containing protein [Dokdonella sp.]|uniref:choice-of-anchor Q domain-containing protein n=1 Tax=Dokdonella sp. TaxID=2291710 RepID=UPI002F3FDF2F
MAASQPDLAQCDPVGRHLRPARRWTRNLQQRFLRRHRRGGDGPLHRRGGDAASDRSDGSTSTAFDTGAGNLDADPLLGAPGDNGGVTPTMPPAAGSAAIDAGSDTDGPATDPWLRPRATVTTRVGGAPCTSTRPGNAVLLTMVVPFDARCAAVRVTGRRWTSRAACTALAVDRCAHPRFPWSPPGCSVRRSGRRHRG